jgi:nucleoid-associated protein YgaU
MRRLIGLIALLVVILGAAWLVHEGYDRAQTAGDTAAVEPPAAGEESSMSADVWDTTPAPEPSAAGSDSEPRPAEPLSSSTAETETAEESTTSDTEMAIAEPAMPQESEANAAPPVGAVPSFDVVRVEPTGNTVIAGLAAPEATVELLDGANTLATAEANERGEWAFALEEPLPPGTHDLAIRTTSADKTVVTLSDQRVAVEIAENGAEQPLVVLNEPNAPSQVMQVPAGPDVALAPSNGAPQAEPMTAARDAPAAAEAPAAASGGMPETETAAASPEPGLSPEPPAGDRLSPSSTSPPTPETGASISAPTEEQAPADATVEPGPKVTVAAVEAETNGALYIAGTAITSESVRVYIDEELIGETTPSESGTWLVETMRELPPGEYMVRADQVEGGSGSVVARAEVPFEREIEVAILKPTAASGGQGSAEVSGSVADPTTVIIKRGDNLWRISRDMYGEGLRYSTIYQANREQIRNPDLIYPGQVFVLPSGDTTWESN